MRHSGIVGLAGVLALVSCGTTPEVIVPDITVSAAPRSIPADGVATSTVTVSRPGQVLVTLKTTGGTFENGTKTIEFATGSGEATLKSCDSLANPSCAGTAYLTASSSDGAAGATSVALVLVRPELCNNGRDDNGDGLIDCADTATCGGRPCRLSGQDGGVELGLCEASGTRCLCATGVTERCDDGIDNNCDGKVDCADTLCAGQSCRQSNGNGGLCTSGACVCAGRELCNNGVDDDCDGKIDCDDSDCQARGTTPGAVCDSAKGLTCTAASGTGSGTCTVCPGGISPETQCSDGLDNDCDGLADCFDIDCDAKACRTGNGLKCQFAGATNTDHCVCSGNGGAPQATETTCDDGFDNDCDGKVDCADPDCLTAGGQTCGTFGKKCTALNACTCGAVTEDCRTPGDDDCNGLINCQEAKCQPVGNGLGASCDLLGNTCSPVLSGPSTCTVCSGNGGTKELAEGSTGGASNTCGDGKDNDCDGRVDCQDSDCTGKSCSNVGGVCNVNGACGCPGGVTNETGSCQDGVDNDCDGLVDCADPDCRAYGSTPASACGTGNGFTCTPAGACACSGNGGTAQPGVETTCNDGRDNDCDGLVDCADPQCRPVGNNLGKTCDAVGNTCANPDAGVSSCAVCSGNGGTAQSTETSCGDGFDNDCDGLIDCQDPGCNALACSATGKRCAGQVCACPGPEAAAEVSCGDGLDNDCDGLVDCADPDCRPSSGVPGKACSATGKTCNAASACVCGGNGGVAEVTEGAVGPSTCGDGVDNDCDGLIDCADADCRPAVGAPALTLGKDCSHAALFGVKCDLTGVCVCPGGQANEATCDDHLDNDCDGTADCADPDCLSKACSTFGKTCASTSSAASACACPSGLTSETNCLDGSDNDCDGKTDCDDPDCQGTPGKNCSTASINYLCTQVTSTWVCKDQSSNFTVTVTSSRLKLPADGLNTATISATLRNLGVVQSGKTIAFSVSGTGGGSVLPLTAVTDGSGVATTTFTSGTANGVATVTATYDTGGTGTGPYVSGSTNVDLPRLGQIKFISAQYPIMGVKYSSFQETNQITFQVLDTANQPYPPGLAVAFTHSPVGGSYIGSVPACSVSSCTATGLTDAAGFVTVYLHSGTVAGVVAVSANATAGGGAGNAQANTIAIVGAKANGLHVSLDCSPKNIPGFNSNDCTNSFVASNISCRASFADRFNNVLGVATTATFSTEAGAAGPPAQTPVYSPGSNALGQANGFVNVAGYSLPVDVAPFAGEYSETYATSCGTRTHNPRDGLVTIIVSAIGEEGFVDTNANGVYDPGEFFVDQGEPFVDANDNGIRDNNEPYTDVNRAGNVTGSYDGPNGLWDSDTVVWAETRVLYSGYASVLASGLNNDLSRFYWTGDAPPTPSAQPFFSLPITAPPQSQSFGVYFADQNFNVLAAATDYSLSVVTGTQQAAFTTAPNRLDVLGLSFTQQFCLTPTGGACSSECTSSPCYIVSNVAGYTYGKYGTVQVTAGGVVRPVCEVRATATYGGVAVPLSLFGDLH